MSQASFDYVRRIIPATATGFVVPAVAPTQTTHWDSTEKGTNIVLSDNDNTAKNSVAGWNTVFATTSKPIADTGLYYFEFKFTDLASRINILVGIETPDEPGPYGDLNTYMGNSGTGDSVFERAQNGSGGNLGSTFTYIGSTPVYSANAGDVVAYAIDMATKKGWFAYNNTFGGDPVAETNPDFTWVSLANNPRITMSLEGTAGTMGATLQTAAATQTYSPPSGYSPWDP